MKAQRLPRWAISFADLVLLLLAFTVMVNMAMDRRGHAASVPIVPSVLDKPAVELFEQGEARLTSGARARIQAVGAAAAGDTKRLTVESVGVGEGAARFDRWELAAARTAAVARALAEGGVDESRIDIALLTPSPEHGLAGQTIAIRRR